MLVEGSEVVGNVSYDGAEEAKHREWSVCVGGGGGKPPGAHQCAINV